MSVTGALGLLGFNVPRSITQVPANGVGPGVERACCKEAVFCLDALSELLVVASGLIVSFGFGLADCFVAGVGLSGNFLNRREKAMRCKQQNKRKKD
jgi:hypothetical protein